MRKTPHAHTQLSSLLERDETPEVGTQSSIDQVLSSPQTRPDISLRDRIAQLSAINTPTTEPRPSHANMHPEKVQQTTAKEPDSGFKLGFTDIKKSARRSIASVQNSPLRHHPRQSLPPPVSENFEFKFAHSSHLSEEAQKLMNNVREEAARIKSHMQAEKNKQDQEDVEAEQEFTGVSAAGRKIAKPKGKAGRFSDVHMQEFKKMGSIANHPSAFRAKPGFAQPTQNSLKRSGSRAGFDEPERPRTAGKGTPGRPPPPFIRPASASPFKSTTRALPDRLENLNSAKRARQSEHTDVSNARLIEESSKPSALPRPKSSISSTSMTPTVASLARSASTKVLLASPDKKSQLLRASSVKSLTRAFEAVRRESGDTKDNAAPATATPVSRLPRSESMKSMRPLPPLPTTGAAANSKAVTLSEAPPMKNVTAATPRTGFGSRLPTFAGLKSILRSRPSPIKTINAPDQAGGTPKRNNTIAPGSSSAKKVDFTPSTKSRYAVKLAANSPSPSKSLAIPPVVPYDPAAYTIDSDHEADEEDWEDAESEVVYPTLGSSPDQPAVSIGPVVNTFAQKAKDHNRHESKEFKSIFTTLEHPSRSSNKLGTVSTNISSQNHQTKSAVQANMVTRSPSATPRISTTSPSTIRRVRTSGVSSEVQPFEDTGIKQLEHGLPSKLKRRRESGKNDSWEQLEGSKENRRSTFNPSVPGGWGYESMEGVVEQEVQKTEPTASHPVAKGKRAKVEIDSEDAEVEDEGQKRGGKRARVGLGPTETEKKPDEKKKPNKAREEAKANAKGRKSMAPGQPAGAKKGILSLSRLNALARPKERK